MEMVFNNFYFLIIILALTPFSSAIDRIALYMIPLQLVVFSYLPDIFGKKELFIGG